MRSALRLATQARSAPTATATGPRGTSKLMSAPPSGGRGGALAGPAEDQQATIAAGRRRRPRREPPAEPPPRPSRERPGRCGERRGAAPSGRVGTEPAERSRRVNAVADAGRSDGSIAIASARTSSRRGRRRSGGGDLRPRRRAVGGEHRELVVAGERRAARQHVEGDAPERVDVRRASTSIARGSAPARRNRWSPESPRGRSSWWPCCRRPRPGCRSRSRSGGRAPAPPLR